MGLTASHTSVDVRVGGTVGRGSHPFVNVANRCSHRRINGAGCTASHASDFAFVEAVVVVYADRRAMCGGVKVGCSVAGSALNY